MFVEVEGHPLVYAIADEDLDRENAEKTAAVHFVRFELAPAACAEGLGRVVARLPGRCSGRCSGAFPRHQAALPVASVPNVRQTGVFPPHLREAPRASLPKNQCHKARASYVLLPG